MTPEEILMSDEFMDKFVNKMLEKMYSTDIVGSTYFMFSTKQEAIEWMTSQVNDPYQDNERFAFTDDPLEMAMYNEQKVRGCCGSFDEEVVVDGRAAMIGCNYGH